MVFDFVSLEEHRRGIESRCSGERQLKQIITFKIQVIQV
jgi:hypothetical protein